MNLNEGISTPIAILLMIAVSAVAGVAVWQPTKLAEELAPKQTSDYTTQSACKEVGYYWYNDACHEEKQEENSLENTEPTSSTPITLISPNGGEEWEVENKYELSWDGHEELSQNEKIGLFLWKGEEELYQINNIKSSLPESGTLEWPLSDKIACGAWCIYLEGGSNYKVEAAVISFDDMGGIVKNYSDFSDDYFTINAPGVKECLDSDGGKNYFESGGATRGTICAQGAMIRDWIDHCSNSNTLIEYYCADSYSSGSSTAGSCKTNVKSTTYQCSNGCNNGACLGGD